MMRRILNKKRRNAVCLVANNDHLFSAAVGVIAAVVVTVAADVFVVVVDVTVHCCVVYVTNVL